MLRRIFGGQLVGKLFLSYLGVIVIGVLILLVAVELVVPQAFDRHLAVMGGMFGMMGGRGAMMQDFLTNFRNAVNEAFMLGTAAAVLMAGLFSLLLSRRMIRPLQQLTTASQKIAEGNFQERVPVPRHTNHKNLDELNQLAVSFNQMAARLEQIETKRRQLIGDVTHELRTPLAAIKGSMEGLMDGVLTADAETYQQVYREADRLQRLVEDLQTLSRVESGEVVLDMQPCSLSELVNRVTSRLAVQYQEKGVELVVNLPEELPQVRADQDRIVQVLINLIGNALQYTPAGGKVTVTSEIKPGILEISVTDTGTGIPAEHLPYVFDRFYRVDKSRSRLQGGTGIGLTIARHLVEAQGGKIWAESDGPGEGSTFRFTLLVA
jgi:signal transduction histidine kinase